MKVTKKKPGQEPGSMHIDRRAEQLLAAEEAGQNDVQLLTTREVATWLGVSVQFLEIARHKGTGPEYTVLSPKVILYQRKKVKKWLEERTYRHTAEYMRKAGKR